MPIITQAIEPNEIAVKDGLFSRFFVLESHANLTGFNDFLTVLDGSSPGLGVERMFFVPVLRITDGSSYLSDFLRRRVFSSAL
jgi:hypothetical protein